MNESERTQKVKEYMKKEFEASDLLQELTDQNTPGEIADSAENVVKELLENTESEERRQKVFVLVYRMGQSIGSKEMAEYGKDKLEEMMG